MSPFLALVGIGELLPGWIPWHVFWVAFFGAVFQARRTIQMGGPQSIYRRRAVGRSVGASA